MTEPNAVAGFNAKYASEARAALRPEPQYERKLDARHAARVLAQAIVIAAEGPDPGPTAEAHYDFAKEVLARLDAKAE